MQEVPVVEAGSFFEDDVGEAELRDWGGGADTSARAIQRGCRRFLARRELGERLYARLEAELAGRPGPAALRVIQMFPQQHLAGVIALQRRFRDRHSASTRTRGCSVHQRDEIAALMEAVEEAGLFFALEGGDQNTRVVGHAFVGQLDKPFSAETAAQLSLEDLHELTAVLNRNISSLKSDLDREEQMRADLTEQCERRERLIEQIVFRVGKHYSARKQLRKRAPPPGLAPPVR